MSDLIRLLRNPSTPDSTKLRDPATEERPGIKPSSNPFRRAVEELSHKLSPELRARNRAGLDSYVRELHSVNQELAQVADRKLSATRTSGKALTVRDVRKLASRDLVSVVERQANELKSGFISRGIFGGGKPWSGGAMDEQRLTQVRQSLELVIAHLSGSKDSEAVGRLNSIAHQLDLLRGLEPEQWVVPAARLTTKGQHRLEVFNPTAGKMIKTSVTKSEWRAMHTAHEAYRSGGLPADETAARRTAMAVIKATGQTRGLRFLERAPTAALVDLARQVGLGTYEEFDTLHEIQREEDSRVLDRESLRLLDAYNAQRQEFHAKVDFAPVEAPIVYVTQRDTEPDPVADTPQEIKDLRAFYAECLSPQFLVEVDSMPEADRLKKVCCENPKVLLDLICFSDLSSDPEVSEVPPEVLQQLGRMLGEDFAQEVLSAASGEQQLELIKTRFAQLPASDYEALARAMNASVKTAEPMITHVMSQLSREFGTVGGNQARFLGAAFHRYFAEQAPIDQKAMLASYMRVAVPDSPDTKRLAALIQGAGPYLIKLLQMVGDNVSGENSKELKESLAFVKSGLPPIHPELRNAMLAAIVNDSGGAITGLKSVRSLGAASVGETFLTNVQRDDGSSESVVVKLLRPGIAERAGRERLYMDAVAQTIPGMAGTFAGIADQIEGEMDLRSEARNVRLGAVYDQHGDVDVKSMKLAPGGQERSFYMMIEKAPGSTVAHYNKMLKDNGGFRNEVLHPYVVGSRLATLTSGLAEKWLEEALFGSGFYHGDLHAGNLMYKADEGGPNGTLTVIDFGNSKVLNETERQAIFKMMLTAAMKSPEEFCQHFESVLTPEAREALTPEVRTRFVGRLTEIFNVEGRSPGVAISLALDAANELYIEVPGVISNFSRSELMMENALNELAERNHENWGDFKQRMEGWDALVARRVKSFNRCLDDSIAQARNEQPPNPETIQRLEAIRARPPVELEDDDVKFLGTRPEPMRALTRDVLAAVALGEETLPETEPQVSGIGDVIMNVVTRHARAAAQLSGASLAARAVRNLA